MCENLMVWVSTYHPSRDVAGFKIQISVHAHPLSLDSVFLTSRVWGTQVSGDLRAYEAMFDSNFRYCTKATLTFVDCHVQKVNQRTASIVGQQRCPHI
jgi:hypothetical protein